MIREEFYPFFSRAGISREQMNAYSETEFQNTLCTLLDGDYQPEVPPARRAGPAARAPRYDRNEFSNGGLSEDEALQKALDASIDDMLVAPHLRAPPDPRNEIHHANVHPPHGVLSRQNHLGGVPKELQPKPTPLPAATRKISHEPSSSHSSRSNQNVHLNYHNPPPKPAAKKTTQTPALHAKPKETAIQAEAKPAKYETVVYRPRKPRQPTTDIGLNVRPAPRQTAAPKKEKNFADMMDAEYQRRDSARVPSARSSGMNSQRSTKSKIPENKPEKKKENVSGRAIRSPVTDSLPELPNIDDIPKLVHDEFDIDEDTERRLLNKPSKKPTAPLKAPSRRTTNTDIPEVRSKPSKPSYEPKPAPVKSDIEPEPIRNKPEIKNRYEPAYIPQRIQEAPKPEPPKPAPQRLPEPVSVPEFRNEEKPKPIQTPVQLTSSQELRNLQDLQYEQLVREAEEKAAEEERQRREEEERQRREEQEKQDAENRLQRILARMPPEPADGLPLAVNLNGKRIQRKFLATQLAQDVYAWVASESEEYKLDTFELSCMGQPPLKMDETLEAQNIKGRTMLSIVEL